MRTSETNFTIAIILEAFIEISTSLAIACYLIMECGGSDKRDQ